ncbi:MAG: GH25 family lysozyme [Methylocystis sp.]|uniref:GH25 family lysozyme n=1 Tax=Methylocystis sp. TaxID=1911079 RepID=UPI0039341D03
MWKTKVALTVVALILAGHAAAEDLLENDFSRGQLFAKYVLPASPKGGEVLSLDRDFDFPKDVATLKSSGKEFLVGVDVSHHNTDNCSCQISWVAVYDAGARFVYAKASQGRGADGKLEGYLKGINALPADKHLYKGTYHFLSADGAGEMQAQFYVENLDKRLAAVGAKRGPDDLPPVVDLEWDHRVIRGGRPAPCSDGMIHKDCWELVPSDQILSRVSAWLKRVRELTGREPLIYTAKSWVRERIGREDDFAKLGVTVWVADYVPHDKTGKRTILTVNPRIPKGTTAPLWQFSDRASMPDESNLDGVDTNVFKGTAKDFEQTFLLRK